MKNHHTKSKGDIGLTQVIADLTKRGYGVSLPISEHLPYDIIMDHNNILKRIQVKYSVNGIITGACSYLSNSGSVRHFYKLDDFDIYAMYIPKIEKCVYIPNMKLIVGITIRFNYPKNNRLFHWWEDFQNPEIISIPKQRRLSELDNNYFKSLKPKIGKRKVINRPDYQTLKNEINILGYVGTGKKYNVSDNAIRKWEKLFLGKINMHS